MSVQPGGGGNEDHLSIRANHFVDRSNLPIAAMLFYFIFVRLSPGQNTARRPSAGGTARGNQPRSMIFLSDLSITRQQQLRR